MSGATHQKQQVTDGEQIDLKIPPEQKPKSGNFPKKDPMAFLIPLYDSYAAPSRAENQENPRMSPIVSAIETLPERMLLIIPGIDIIVHEQLAFVERVKKEIQERGLDKKGRMCEAKVVDDAFHGWLEREWPNNFKRQLLM